MRRLEKQRQEASSALGQWVRTALAIHEPMSALTKATHGNVRTPALSRPALREQLRQ
jgi:hypothetical protein